MTTPGLWLRSGIGYMCLWEETPSWLPCAEHNDARMREVIFEPLFTHIRQCRRLVPAVIYAFRPAISNVSDLHATAPNNRMREVSI